MGKFEFSVVPIVDELSKTCRHTSTEDHPGISPNRFLYNLKEKKSEKQKTFFSTQKYNNVLVHLKKKRFGFFIKRISGITEVGSKPNVMFSIICQLVLVIFKWEHFGNYGLLW